MRRVLLTTPLSLAPDGSWPHQAPDHYGFGISRFRAHGYEVIELPPGARRGRLRALRRLPAGLGARYGDLAVQAAVVAASPDVDLIYDPWDVKGNALVLAGLRAGRALRRPLVAYVHSAPLSRAPAWQWPARELFFSGCDALPAMSPSVADELRSHTRWAAKTSVVRPGPDAGYYRPASGPGRDIVCVGKSLRDFETLGRAASQTTARVHIVCPRSAVTPAFARFGPNVTVTTADHGRLLPRGVVDALVREARAVAIPLSTTRLMAGLWSLFDGLGFAKPVLMTRHPGVPIDIEAEGIGRWIELGDERGWADALQFFDDHADEASAMGRRARALVDDGLDSATFAEQMARVFDDVLARERG